MTHRGTHPAEVRWIIAALVLLFIGVSIAVIALVL